MKPQTRQSKWYYANKEKSKENVLNYRKKWIAIGKYAAERKLITKKDLRKIETFIFGNTVSQILEKMKTPSEKTA